MNETVVKTPQEIVIDMIKGISLLASKIDILNHRIERIEKVISDDVLNTRIEDLTKAMDDHRSSIMELSEVTDNISGIFSVFLALMEDAGDIARENNSKVTWEDIGMLLRKYREESSKENDDDEEDDGE